jgi:methionyl-tRNA synthetase
MLGGQGQWAGMPRIDEVDEEGGRSYPVITGDYSDAAVWRSEPIRPGTPLSQPTPLFAKLDPAVAEEELARLGSG